MKNFLWLNEDKKFILNILSPKNEKSFFVGGAVRNSLIYNNYYPKDFDIATSLTPEEVAKILHSFGKVIFTGLSHGTITFIYKEEKYEITTFRKDAITDGRHAKVVYTKNVEIDSNRRDFTVNALYLDAFSNVLDFHNGKEDIKNKILKFIGCPNKRINEDYLRIMRFFRFHAQHLYKWDEASLNACILCKDGLKQIAKERIKSELMLLLSGKNMFDSLYKMKENNILYNIYSENFVILLNKIKEVEKKVCINVLSKFCLLINNAACSDFLLLSKKEKKILKVLASTLIFKFPDKDSINQWLCDFTYEECKIILPAVYIKSFSHENAIKYIQYFYSLGVLPRPVFPLRGRDVMKIGCSGKEIGRKMNITRKWWIDKKCYPCKNECIKFCKKV